MKHKTNRDILSRAWYDFVVLKKDDIYGIDELILESWKRSRARNIDYEKVHPLPNDREAAQSSKRKNHMLIDIAKPYMDDLYKIINNTNFMVTLLDKEGYILETIIHPKLVEKNKFSSLNLSEDRIGTNAIGTCLYINKPIQTYGEEHYHKLLHSYTTSAAPIHDQEGNLIGVIGITGFADDISLHTLGMAIAAAYAIENRYRLFQEKQNLLVKSYSSLINHSTSDGIIILDSKSRITSVNKRAENILGIRSEDVLYKKIEDVLQGSIDFGKYLNSNEDSFNINAILNINNNNINCNVSLIKLKSDLELMGYIIMINPKEGTINLNLERHKKRLYTFEDIVGETDIIKECISIVKIASRGNSNILILGESGTGKELFAQSIHSNSPRRDKPFIDVNCGALPVGLAESELFGYEGGAFTSARKEGQIGKFEMANGGTIFLDEIGELPLSVQAALLRVIQEKKVRRIGSTKTVDIDVMIIAATNRDLSDAVLKNLFRKDLFYRLNVFTINLPPLREHKEDIPLLINHFIKKFNKIFSTNIEGVTEEVLNTFYNYDWPGNIRELENIIERSVQVANDKIISVRDLPMYLRMRADKGNTRNDNISLIDFNEKKIIQENLEKYKGNIKLTAQVLGISRATLYRKISKLNIDVEKYRL